MAIIEKIWPLSSRYVGNTSWDRGCVNEMLMGIKMRWWSGLGRQVYDRSTQKEVALDGLKAGTWILPSGLDWDVCHLWCIAKDMSMFGFTEHCDSDILSRSIYPACQVCHAWRGSSRSLGLSHSLCPLPQKLNQYLQRFRGLIYCIPQQLHLHGIKFFSVPQMDSAHYKYPSSDLCDCWENEKKKEKKV